MATGPENQVAAAGVAAVDCLSALRDFCPIILVAGIAGACDTAACKDSCTSAEQSSPAALRPPPKDREPKEAFSHTDKIILRAVEGACRGPFSNPAGRAVGKLGVHASHRPWRST